MGQLSVKSSIWRDIFIYDSDWGWSENTGSHTHTKITHRKKIKLSKQKQR